MLRSLVLALALAFAATPDLALAEASMELVADVTEDVPDAVVEVVPVPTPLPDQDLEIGDWLKAVLDTWGGLGQFVNWQLKVVAVIYLLIGLVRVSLVQPLWEKLGPYKVMAAPGLGLAATVLTLWGETAAAGVGSLTLGAVFAAVTTGAGAIFLHQMMDGIKGMPGVGKPLLVAIALLEKLLKKPEKAS